MGTGAVSRHSVVLRVAVAVAGALSAIALPVAAPRALADDPDNCLFCHQYRGLSRYDAAADRLHLYFVQPEYVHERRGPHARAACTDCHLREEVSVVPHKTTTPVNCTQTCHLNDPTGIERRFSHAGVADVLARSAHPPEVLDGLSFAGGPVLSEGQSQCLYCHDEPLFRDPTGAMPVLSSLGGRTFDRCDTCHREQIPSDVAYYLRHIASRLQPARPTLELAQICGLCHSDPAVLAQHEIPNSVGSYMRSYHGKAALLGDQETANCLSCHVRAGGSAHLMLGPQDPASSVNVVRVADSCRSTACHPGADKALAAAAVHLDLPTVRGSLEFIIAALFIVLTVATFGPSMLICVLELLDVVVGRHSHAEHRMLALTQAVLDHPLGRRKLTRFTVNQRVQHWVLVALFATLALTGFPMKFADQAWAKRVIDVFGGLSTARTVHHWAGLALATGMLMHLGYVVATIIIRRRHEAPDGRRGLVAAVTSLPMWVTPADGVKGLKLLAYLAYLSRERPTFGRFNVKEKFEYIGVFWGTALLGITGIMLWGEQLVSHVFGGRVFNIALIAHTYEAFLAVIHVGILHIVNVILAPHVFPLSLATLSGKTPISELAEGHSEFVEQAALELGVDLDLEAGHA
ncbi:MAG: hypothetical protein HRF50_02765 [Phycisphaerae bacterium]|jgi:cytochrome b subunit of formate dehydrogenase